jgi:glycosyltransferase involved in cell wall biosynthesis
MNIVLVYLGKTGAAVFTYEIIRALLNRGCNLCCILSQYIDNYSHFVSLEKDHANLKIVFIKTYKTKQDFFLRTFNLFNFIKLRQIIKCQTSDYIYIPMISIWSSILCLFIKNKNIITTIHDVRPHQGEENVLLDLLFSYSIKISTKVIVLSKKFISDVIKRYDISEKNIYHIPHANYNYYLFNKNSSSNTIINKKIIFFGHISKYKGILILLEAMKIVIKSDNDIILKIAGGGNLSENEKSIIKELGQKVELINRYIDDDEIYSLFDDVDFTVLPYIEASQSGVIMLSYSFKKPVIATSVGGLSEQILPSTGILIPPNDKFALADAILNLYKSPSQIIQMGLNAYNYSSNELTWDSSAEKIINIMRDIERS